jgi:WD40 repeat protein
MYIWQSILACLIALPGALCLHAAGPRTDADGDPLPPGALARLGSLRFRVPYPLEKLHASLSPDGKQLLLATDGELIVMDTTSGKELRHFELGEHSHFIPAFSGIPFSHTASTLSDDTRLLGVLEEAGGVYLYDTATGKLIKHFDTVVTGSQTRLFLSADGKRVAGTTGDSSASATATIYDTQSGRKAASVAPMQNGASAAFSADGKRLATWGEGLGRRQVVQAWDSATGNELQRITVEGQPVTSVAFSPDGTQLAIAQAEGIVSLFEVAGGKRLRRWEDDKGDSDLCFAPDGRTLAAVGRDDRILLWNVLTGRGSRGSPPPRGRMVTYRLLPDGTVLVCVAVEMGFYLWDALRGVALTPFYGHGSPVGAIAFHPERRELLSASSDGIYRWNLRTGKREKLRPSRHGLYRLNQDYWTCLAADGRHVMTTLPHEWGIRLFELETDVELLLNRGVGFYELDTGVVSANSKIFAGLEEVSGRQGKELILRVFDARSGQEQRKFRVDPSDRGMLGVFASPDGVRVGAVTGKGTTGAPVHPQVWDIASGKEIRVRPTTGAKELALSPGGRLLAVTDGDDMLQVQDLELGEEWPALESPGEGMLFAPTFSPDSRFLAAAWSSPDWERSRIVVWELGSSQIRAEFSGHRGTINALALSPDGRLLASGGRDTTVLLWDLLGDKLEQDKPAAEDLHGLWRDLDGNARTAHRALARLAKAPAEAVTLVREHLPPAPGSPPEPREIARWIADLDSDSFQTRQQATRALREIGRIGESAMEEALKGTPSLEQKRRLEELLRRLHRTGVAAEMLRPVRALELLERICTPEARRLVEELAAGNPTSDLTRYAQEVRQRLATRGTAER